MIGNIFRWRWSLAAAAFLILLAGCAPSGQSEPAETSRLNVVATTTFVGDAVRRVAGEEVNLTVLLAPGQNPHAYQSTPRDLVRVSDADLVFANGLGLEEFLDDLLEGAENQEALVVVSQQISPLEMEADDHTHGGGDDHDQEDHDGEHKDGEHHDGEDHDGEHHDGEEHDGEHHDGEDHEGEHHHQGQDPHVWFDPNNVMLWVEVISETLSEADPQHAELYRQNAENYRAEMQELDSWIREQVATIPEENRELVTDHASFGYFAQEYGFEQIGAVIPAPTTEAETSGQQLAALMRTIEEHQVKAVFVSKDIDPSLAERVAEDTGVELVPLYFGSLTGGEPAENYLDFMRYNVEAVVSALK